MRTHEIAKRANVHPNTVRLYEEWGFISPVPWKPNGYRLYDERHVIQMQIARLAFKEEFIQNNLRKKATELVLLSGQERFAECLQAAYTYDLFLQHEQQFALQAVQMVEQLRIHTPKQQHKTYTHQQAALELDVTEHTLRHWERNGLYTVMRNAQNRRLYTEADMQKLLIIRTLRSAHFSVARILQLFQQLERENKQPILALLGSPAFTDDFYHVTDELFVHLQQARKNIQKIKQLLQVALAQPHQ
ncbi:MerR family transcriptional regulator [Caryophanon tenue]|uniref:HTH merR-type domain-containing protein n=1 Tax=Caryophanon tenue TaxID=33978 RepID=A0A1C0YHY3_9BACL|nr:MerR family transcriptional regulator [Caryophanon tenue]OCS86786.1 hypothetical protein A6M13_12580 [Caryophanon tenue]